MVDLDVCAPLSSKKHPGKAHVLVSTGASKYILVSTLVLPARLHPHVLQKQYGVGIWLLSLAQLKSCSRYVWLEHVWRQGLAPVPKTSVGLLCGSFLLFANQVARLPISGYISWFLAPSVTSMTILLSCGSPKTAKETIMLLFGSCIYQNRNVNVINTCPWKGAAFLDD